MLETIPEKQANEIAVGAEGAEPAEIPENNKEEITKEGLTQEIEQITADLEKLGKKEDDEKIQDLFQLMGINDPKKVYS